MTSTMARIKVIDNDRDEITAELSGKLVRSWSYQDEAGRCLRMQKAHEFAEGWYQRDNLTPKTDILADLRERDGAGDWYCKNCGYMSGGRITNSETCDQCHIPVEWHSVSEMTEFEALREREARLVEALESVGKISLDGYETASPLKRCRQFKGISDIAFKALSKARGDA